MSTPADGGFGDKLISWTLLAFPSDFGAAAPPGLGMVLLLVGVSDRTGVSVTRRGVTWLDGRVGVILGGICVTGIVNLSIFPVSFLTELPALVFALSSLVDLFVTGVRTILFAVLPAKRMAFNS